MKEEIKNSNNKQEFKLYIKQIFRNLSYRLNCGKNAKCKNLKIKKTKNERIMLLSICAVCNSKKIDIY